MISFEVDRDKAYYNNVLKQSGSDLAGYLKMMNKTESDFQDDLTKTATTRITHQLILESIIKSESISASDEDITNEIKTQKPDADTPEKIEEARKKMNIDSLKDSIIQRKTFDFLIEHAKIKEITPKK